MKRSLAAVALFLLASAAAPAAPSAKPRFKAVAFDYFVPFDPSSVVPEVDKVFPGMGAEFTKAWRSKQFEYGFLRSITHHHRDFLAVKGFIVAYDGWSATGIAQGKKVAADPTVFELYRDRTYRFADQKAKDAFDQNRDDWIARADARSSKLAARRAR